MALLWAFPFAGLLLSIALCPLFAPHWWPRRFGRVTAFWALSLLVPLAVVRGGRAAAEMLLTTTAREYAPFIALLFALFVVAGGIRIVGNLVGTPLTNTVILALGTAAANLLGTTGASILLIRPVIRANEDRRHKAHIFVFFIFLVGNIGGALTPLGDPPLFLGYLRGVDFGWTLTTMVRPFGFAAVLLLLLFYVIDVVRWQKDKGDWPASRVPRRIRVEGWHNLLFLGAIVAAVLASGVVHTGRTVALGLDVAVPLEDALRDGLLLVVAMASWLTTPGRLRIENAFTWTPIREVAILFAGIFLTVTPVLDAMRAGPSGPFARLFALVNRPDGTPIDAAYFWITGALSSVLDNAPTYLVFFDLAGGDPHRLTGALSRTLLAISTGAVFMGANTYLGNAPNFMVKAICEEQGIRMPTFLGYMLWSTAVLLPLFALMTAVFFS